MIGQKHNNTNADISVESSLASVADAGGNSSTIDTVLDKRIKELITYARGKDQGERTSLFRNLIDMFLTGKAPTVSDTRHQLLMIVKALIPHVDDDVRQTSCNLVASITQPPMDLALVMAQDRASLSSTLLRQVPFSEEQMIDLVQNTGRAHHQEIASRNDLSANVWIALARAAPVIEPSISEQELWNDQFFEPRPSATVTALHPERLWDGLVNIGKEDQSKHMDEAVFLQNTDQEDEQDPFQMTGDHLDEDHLPAYSKSASSDSEAPTKDTSNDTSGKDYSQSWLNPGQTVQRSFEKDSDVKISDAKTPNVKTPNVKTSGEKDLVSQAVTGQQASEDAPVASWSWHCDRALVVDTMEGLAPEISSALPYKEGATVLDLLGLSEKPNHPIVKALQRRGTIHDVPVYLKTFPKGHRYWTMEATPTFDLSSGAFKGYKGILTGVMPSGDDVNFELPTELPKPRIEIPDRPETDILAPADQQSAESVESVESAVPPAASVDLQAIIQQQTGDVMSDALETIRSSVEKQVASHMDQLTADRQKTQEGAEASPDYPSSSDQGPKALSPSLTTALASTLTQLEHSLSILSSQALQQAPADQSIVKLHTTIAEECLKSMREQLNHSQ